MKLKKIDIKKSINKGVKFLIKNQKEDGSLYLNNDTRWQVWETANAYIAVNSTDTKNKNFLDKSIEFLLDNQRDDGSFSHDVNFKKNHYCIETTSVCLHALSINKKDITKGINFIIEKQNSDGSWDIGTPEIIKYRRWPSVTGFALNILIDYYSNKENITKGIEYILNSQLNDGSWGSKWIYYDTSYYTLYPILSSLKKSGHENSPNYNNAIQFIKNNQNSDGSWIENTTDKPKPSICLRTSLALCSLLITPNQNNIYKIEKGIEYLINQQENEGYWDGGYFVNWPNKKEDIYTTSMSINVLTKYLNSF